MTGCHPIRRSRSWLRRTARCLLPAALAGALPIASAAAQSVAPNAAPQGGQVVGGAASIAQTPGTTQINQSSNRAIIDWRSFNVGQNHAVDFQQPSSQSLTLNRVTGPDMSVIAGRITANGGVALVNQSGVFFAHGAQVQAQSVIVSTADISNQNFMAGGPMRFDRPGKPDARIVNNGRITIRQAGLAALVAPQVANHGTIQARLGTVVLGGAETHVIDLNGDGLVSFDVTGAVRKAPNNGEALVTNDGVIRASGGTVQLTAAAADGIVQDLVRTGGRIEANTDAASGAGGHVLLQGTGGSISVSGTVSAQGRAAGTKGGTIEVLADRVQVEGSARIDASGRAGGGSIAIGTSLPDAATRRLAQATGIARGAVIRANATAKGNGGHVVVNSSQQTAIAGSISVRGGPSGGDGGVVELSGQGGFALSGPIDAGAAAGHPGSVVIDPDTLTVVSDTDPRANVTNGELAGGILASGTDPGADDYITAQQIANITGSLTLQAVNSIQVEVAVNKPQGDLALQSGGSLTIDAPLVLGNGNLQLEANVITINSGVTVPTANTVTLTMAGRLGGTVTEGASGAISAGTLTQTGGAFTTIDLGGANTVQTIQTLYATDLAFNNVVPLTLSGQVIAGNSLSIRVNGGDLTIDSLVATTGTNPTAQVLASGNISIGALAVVQSLNLQMTAGYDFVGNAPDPTAAGGITIAGAVLGAMYTGNGVSITSPVALAAGTGGITETAGGIVQTTSLTVQSGGTVSLPTLGTSGFDSNQVDELGPSSVHGDFTLATYAVQSGGASSGQGTIFLTGDVGVSGTLTLQTVNADLQENAGARILASVLAVTADGSITLPYQNQITLLGAMSASVINVHNVIDLEVAGPVSSAAGVTIATEGNLLVSGSVSTTDSNILLTAGGDLTVAATGSLTAATLSGIASITLQAAAPATGFDVALPGAMTLAGAVSAATDLVLDAGTGGITQTGGNLEAATLTVRSGGDALLDRGGIIGGTPNSIVGAVSGMAAGDFELDNGTTDITVAETISAGTIGLRTSGTLNLTNQCLSLCTPASLDTGDGRITLQAGALAFAAGDTVSGGIVEISSTAQHPLVAGDAAGTVIAGSFMVNQDVLAEITSTTLRLGAGTFRGTTGVTATSLTLGGPVTLPNTLDLRSLGDITQAPGAAFAVGTITGAANGDVRLTLQANSAASVGDFSAGNTLDLTLGGAMTIAGTLSASNVVLVSELDMTETGGGLIAADQLTVTSNKGLVGLAGDNVVYQLNASTAATAFAFTDTSDNLTVPVGNVVQAGASLTIANSGDLTIDGTATGTTTVLDSTTGTLTVNGHSAIARVTTLVLTAPEVVTTGLISAPDTIVISATTATLGGQALGLLLDVSAATITFQSLDASTMRVLLIPGVSGTMSGTLQALALQVNGGSSATLTGSIAGISTGAAAAIGVRASNTGIDLGKQPPNPDAFTFNGCPIAAGCPVVTPPVVIPNGVTPPVVTPPVVTPPAVIPAGTIAPSGVATSPGTLLTQTRPRQFDPSLTDVWFGPPTPPAAGLLVLPSRDLHEDLELAPPNVRAEDY